MSEALRPILVTGAHRSGTTWVGKMLAADAHTAYISEPLNVLHRPGVLRAKVTHWYQYICAENEENYLSPLLELLSFRYHFLDEVCSIRSHKDFLRMGRDFWVFINGRFRSQRSLIKDPFAVFSVPWFAKRLNCKVIITVRHPAAFASSLQRLNWPFDFRDLLDQPLLMRDYLEPYRVQMQAINTDDMIGQASLLWTMIYAVVHKLCEQNPDFIVVRHEDLSLDPVAGYKSLYESLGLEFTARVQDVILNSSSSENPNELSQKKVHSVKLNSRANVANWKKRLSSEEINCVRRITESESMYFYPDQEWQ